MLPQSRLIRLLELTTAILLLAGLVLFGGNYFPFKLVDFSVYWSAGSISVQGGNPYNPDAMLAKQQETGWTTPETKMLLYWYPPWTLPIAMPLGLIGFKTSQILWYLLSIAMIILSISILWQVYQGEHKDKWLAWVVGLLFTPVIYALFFGQVSPLMLLGISGFLFFIKQKTRFSDFLAGASTFLLTIKPALFFLFWPALLFWCIDQRRWKVLLGLALPVLGGALVSSIPNPAIFQEYLKFLGTARVTDWGVPTAGSWLRRVLGQEIVLLQFFPPVVGFTWFFYRWRKNRDFWRWEEQIPWLSIASMVTTPFAWTHDQVILLPAVIAATRQIKSVGYSIQTAGLLLAWVVFNLYTFFSHFTRDDSQFVWQAPAILIFYLVVVNFSRSPVSSSTNTPSGRIL